MEGKPCPSLGSGDGSRPAPRWAPGRRSFSVGCCTGPLASVLGSELGLPRDFKGREEVSDSPVCLFLPFSMFPSSLLSLPSAKRGFYCPLLFSPSHSLSSPLLFSPLPPPPVCHLPLCPLSSHWLSAVSASWWVPGDVQVSPSHGGMSSPAADGHVNNTLLVVWVHSCN